MSMRVYSCGVGEGDALDMRLHFFYWGANFRLETLKVDFQRRCWEEVRNCELEISLLVTEDERRDDVMIKELNEESLRDFCRFPLRQRELLTRGNRLPMKMTTDAQQPRAMCNQNREKCVWWNDWIWNGMENNNFFMCSILIAIFSPSLSWESLDV